MFGIASVVKLPSLAAGAVIALAMTLALAQTPPPLPPPPPADSGAPAPAAPAQPTPRPAQGQPSVILQTPRGAEAQAGETPPSRWQGDLDRLDSDLRLRLLTPNEPRIEWLAGEIETTDIDSQVRHYAAARTNAPGERLYIASLGVACLQPVRPSLAPCDAMDRLADWARRDVDNGVPMILLAGRARQRGEADLAASYVEEAAGAPRFDDYWSQAAARWWNYLRGLDVGIDPAAKAKAALNYASIRDLAWAAPLRALCAEDRERTERMKNACSALGQALGARGATFALRLAGARVAQINASNAPAQAAAERIHARTVTSTARCAQVTPDFAAGFESPQLPARTAAVEQFATWADAQARDGEVVACERRVAAQLR